VNTHSSNPFGRGFWATMLWLPVALGLVLLALVLGYGVGHDRLVPVAMAALVFVPPFWGIALFVWALRNDTNAIGQ
jgi:hypothetical protein